MIFVKITQYFLFYFHQVNNLQSLIHHSNSHLTLSFSFFLLFDHLFVKFIFVFYVIFRWFKLLLLSLLISIFYFNLIRLKSLFIKTKKYFLLHLIIKYLITIFTQSLNLFFLPSILFFYYFIKKSMVHNIFQILQILVKLKIFYLVFNRCVTFIKILNNFSIS